MGGAPKRWNNVLPMKKIKLDDKKLFSDKDVYKYFDLTQEEIEFIKKNIK